MQIFYLTLIFILVAKEPFKADFFYEVLIKILHVMHDNGTLL
jgi:hypothetical protein